MSFVVSIMVPLSLGWAAAHSELPQGLLTPSYGIVSEDDLAYDREQQVPRPYDPNADLNSPHWQCFPLKEVTATYQQWLHTDMVESSSVTEKVCAIEVRVLHKGELQQYIDRRGHDLEYCKDFLKEWAQVTRGQGILSERRRWILLSGQEGRKI